MFGLRTNIQAGNGECQQRERVKDRCAGSVRALHDPGDARPHQQCQDGARAGKDQRIAQQAGDVPARIGFGEILEREGSRPEAGILGEGIVDERRHGHEYQPDGDRDAGDEHQICYAETRLNPARDRRGAGLGLSTRREAHVGNPAIPVCPGRSAA
jgi:hypothetical protein